MEFAKAIRNGFRPRQVGFPIGARNENIDYYRWGFEEFRRRKEKGVSMEKAIADYIKGKVPLIWILEDLNIDPRLLVCHRVPIEYDDVSSYIRDAHKFVISCIRNGYDNLSIDV